MRWFVRGDVDGFFGLALDDPVQDLNRVWGPYERPQAWMGPGLWFLVCLAGFPLLLWWPTHLALSRWAPPAARRG